MHLFVDKRSTINKHAQLRCKLHTNSLANRSTRVAVASYDSVGFSLMV
jgi:hypothetical protein